MGDGHDPDDFYVDERGNGPEGPQPGVHALVIGTSEYQYTHQGDSHYENFENIEGAAYGAAKFAKFLNSAYRDPLDHKILTIRVLLTPTDDEIREINTLGVTWIPATRDRVDAALKAWFRDCDQFSENISILYAAGHGLTRLGASYTHVFLKAEGDDPDAFFYSLNFDVIKEALEYNYSQTKIFISDCCSDAFFTPKHENGILLEPKYERTEELAGVPRKYDPLHIAGARVGAKAYALSASEGTMLSYVIEQLMKAAGELVHHPVRPNEQYFAITQSVMSEQVQPIFRGHEKAELIFDGGPRISGHTVAGGLHRPDPPPDVHIEFAVKETAQTDPVDIVITTRDGIRKGAGTVSSGQKFELELPAGIYVRESNSGKAPLEVDRPKRYDVLSWDSELL